MRIKKQPGNFCILSNLHLLSGLHGLVQAVYIWLCVHSNSDGVCFPSIELLAKEAGCGITSVKTSINKLVEIGLLEKIRNGRRLNNTYQLLDVEKVIDTEQPSQEEVMDVTRLSGDGRHTSTNYINNNNYIHNSNIDKSILRAPDKSEHKTPSKDIDTTAPEQEETLNEKEKSSGQKEKEVPAKPIEPIEPTNPTIKQKTKYEQDIKLYQLKLRAYEEAKNKPPKSEKTEEKVMEEKQTKETKKPNPLITEIVDVMNKRFTARDPGPAQKKRWAAGAVARNIVKHQDVQSGKIKPIDLFNKVIGGAVKDKFRQKQVMNLNTFNNNINKLTALFYT